MERGVGPTGTIVTKGYGGVGTDPRAAAAATGYGMGGGMDMGAGYGMGSTGNGGNYTPPFTPTMNGGWIDANGTSVPASVVGAAGGAQTGLNGQYNNVNPGGDTFTHPTVPGALPPGVEQNTSGPGLIDSNKRPEYGPAPPQAPPVMHTQQEPGVLSTPGYGEQWFKDNKSRYDASGRYQDWYNNYQEETGYKGYQPENTRKAWTDFSNQNRDPGQGTKNAYDVSGQLRQQGQGERTAAGAENYFKAPGAQAQYGAQNRDYFSKAGNAETNYATNAPALGKQGAGEQFTYGQLGEYGKPGAAERNNDYAGNVLSRNNSTQGFNQNLQNTGFTNKNNVGNEYNYFSQGLRDKSDSEKLYDSGNQGLNTFYDREAQKRTKALSDQMAAMGVFGSGATVRGLYELHGELGAAQARDMASLAGQADQARLGRTGAAQSFVQGATNEEMGRYGLGLQSATAADESTRGNVAGMTSAATAAQNAQANRLFQGSQTALNADKQGLDRILGAGALAQGADAAALGRVQAGQTNAAGQDSHTIAQGTGLTNLGNVQGNLERQRLAESGSLGLQGDAENRARLKDYFGGAQDADAAELGAAKANAGFASDYDTTENAKLQQGQNAATIAQNLFENRERYGIKDAQQMASQMSSMVQAATSASADEQQHIFEQMVQALITGSSMSSAQAEQQVQNMFQMAGIVYKFKSLKTGAPAAA